MNNMNMQTRYKEKSKLQPLHLQTAHNKETQRTKSSKIKTFLDALYTIGYKNGATHFFT